MPDNPILIIDDDLDDHSILLEACANLKVKKALKFFTNGFDLMKFLKSSKVKPFLILCDINMPHINGLDLRQVIMEDPELKKKSIPFVFYSTAATTAQVNRAFDLTVQGFFLKGNSYLDVQRKLKIIFDYWEESARPVN